MSNPAKGRRRKETKHGSAISARRGGRGGHPGTGQLQPAEGGISGRRRGVGRRCPDGRGVEDAGPDPLGHHAARLGRAEGLPQAEREPEVRVDPHHHADGQGRGAGHRGGAEHGGRRLRHQAVQPQGACWPGCRPCLRRAEAEHDVSEEETRRARSSRFET